MKRLFSMNKDRKVIDDLLDNIREGYATLIEKYDRPSKLRSQFDIRYREAIKNRVNLINFLKAEQEVTKTLIAQSEERVNADLQSSDGEKAIDSKNEKQNFADKIIEGFEEKIRKYPSIRIHKDASQEIKKLFGAISILEKEYWGIIDGFSSNTSSSKNSESLPYLYPEIDRIANPGTNGVPPAANNYFNLLSRIPQDFIKIEDEKKRCLVKVAILLKKIRKGILKNLRNQPYSDDTEQEKLEEALDYVEGIIEDFRLKDLDSFGGSF